MKVLGQKTFRFRHAPDDQMTPIQNLPSQNRAPVVGRGVMADEDRVPLPGSDSVKCRRDPIYFFVSGELVWIASVDDPVPAAKDRSLLRQLKDSFSHRCRLGLGKDRHPGPTQRLVQLNPN